MTRFHIAMLPALAGLIACSRPTRLPDVFPETMAAWHRTQVRDVPAAQPPDAIPAAIIQQIRTASYTGPGRLEARAYVLSTAAVALDMAQRWTPRANTVFFFSGRFFVVQWQSAEQKALQPFLSALQEKFKSE